MLLKPVLRYFGTDGPRFRDCIVRCTIDRMGQAVLVNKLKFMSVLHTRYCQSIRGDTSFNPNVVGADYKK